MAKLKWDEARQVYTYTKIYPRVGGVEITLKENELPAGQKIRWANGKRIDVEVPDSFLESKMPKYGAKPKEEPKEEFLTPEEIKQREQEAVGALPDTTPFGSEIKIKVQSAQEIANNISYSRSPDGVGYIPPDAPQGTKSYMVVIKPGKSYLGSTFSETVDVTTAEEEMQDVLNQARKIPGGIAELKRKLATSGFYSGQLTQFIPYSLSTGDAEDDYLESALAGALRSQSITNYGYAKQGKNLLNFDEWLDEAKAAYASILSEKSVNYADPRNAREVFISNWQKYTGETPTENQVLAFISAAKSYAASNPDVYSTDVLTGTRYTQPGFNAEQLESFATEYILNTPESKQYGMDQGGVDMFSNAIDGLLNELQAGVSGNKSLGL